MIKPNKIWAKKAFKSAKLWILSFASDVAEFSVELAQYLIKIFHLSFIRFESGKGIFVTTLYKKRGKHARTFIHSGMAALSAVGMMIAPAIAEEFPGASVDPWNIPSPSSVVTASTENADIATQVSDKIRDKIIEYTVAEGDTISTIADKFGIDTQTILWQNDLASTSKIKPGQKLEILPVTGVSHVVQKGDTIYSIAKKYDVDPQPIVNFPFNTFTNDETFGLAVGQIVIVPDGVKPAAQNAAPRPSRRISTPDAGTVVASGQFVWPSQGVITQRFSWYHKAIDIANRASPNIVAADAGTVITAGWNAHGYGNYVILDHGNGYRTLYGHLVQIYVSTGQRVNRGDALGKMGTTGRSTGIHLHFEVIRNGTYLDPLTVLN